MFLKMQIGIMWKVPEIYNFYRTLSLWARGGLQKLAPVRTKTWFINPFIADRWVRRSVCCWQRPLLAPHTHALDGRVGPRTKEGLGPAGSETNKADQLFRQPSTTTAATIGPENVSFPVVYLEVPHTIVRDFRTNNLCPLSTFLDARPDVLNKGQLRFFADFVLFTRWQIITSACFVVFCLVEFEKWHWHVTVISKSTLRWGTPADLPCFTVGYECWDLVRIEELFTQFPVLRITNSPKLARVWFDGDFEENICV